MGGGILANLLSRYNSEFDKDESIRAAVCSQPALDFVGSYKNSDEKLWGLYTFAFFNLYKNQLKRQGSDKVLREALGIDKQEFDQLWNTKDPIKF